MSSFKLPADLAFNTVKVVDPSAFANEKRATSWLFLCGPEFASMEGGMSFAAAQAAVEHAVCVISDPPRTLDLDLARAHVAALDALPRPTVVTCRSGPRASAVVYMYAGLKAGAESSDVLAAAERDGAPFCTFDDYKTWVRVALETLRIR